MSQISPPLRIALVIAVAFLAVWMVVLRPSSSDEAAAPVAATPAPNLESGAPAVSAPGQVVEQAQDAATAAEGTAAARAGEAPAIAAPEASAPAAEAKAPKSAAAARKGNKDDRLPVPVLRAIGEKQVLVLLFWNPRAADDRAVRREVAALSRGGSKVYKHVAHIKDVSRYGAITRGVDLSQSPTTVVVDRRLGATALTGFAARAEIGQLVSDALRVKR